MCSIFTLSPYNPGKHPCSYSKSQLPSAHHLPFPQQLVAFPATRFLLFSQTPPFFLGVSTPFPKNSTLGHGVNSEPTLTSFTFSFTFACLLCRLFYVRPPTRILPNTQCYKQHQEQSLAHTEVEASVRHRSLGHTSNKGRHQAHATSLEVQGNSTETRAARKPCAH